MNRKTILLTSLLTLLSSACAAEFDDSTDGEPIPQGESAITLESADAAEGLRGWLEVDGQTVDIEARRDGEAITVALTTEDVIHAEVRIDLETGNLSGMLPAPSEMAEEDQEVDLDAVPGPVVRAVATAARALPELEGLDDELTALRNLDTIAVSLAGTSQLGDLQAGEPEAAWSKCWYSNWTGYIGPGRSKSFVWWGHEFVTWTASYWSRAMKRSSSTPYNYGVNAWAYCRNSYNKYYYRFSGWKHSFWDDALANCGSNAALIWGRSRARYCR